MLIEGSKGNISEDTADRLHWKLLQPYRIPMMVRLEKEISFYAADLLC